jgi:hypothetical protein
MDAQVAYELATVHLSDQAFRKARELDMHS